MAQGIGFGKTILFGEHFVVYGLPAIASGLSMKTIAKVQPLKGKKGYELIDNRPETSGYKQKKLEEQKKSMDFIFKAMGIDVEKTPLKIELGGNLIAMSGNGASAASCTAIARAISNFFNMSLADEKINEIAFEGEKGYHGSSPGGIDNSCATFGGLLWVKKDLSGGSLQVEKINIKKPFEMVLANTGITTSTAETVQEVRKLKEANKEKFDKIFKEYENIVNEARGALEQYNLEKVGELMNNNQRFLEEITVSCRELDELIAIARKAGAIGAKLTGTGRGGLMQALTPGKRLQDKVAKALEEKAKQVFKIKVGKKSPS